MCSLYHYLDDLPFAEGYVITFINQKFEIKIIKSFFSIECKPCVVTY